MIQTTSPTNQLPRFDRPSEAVVFWTLENLCGGAGGRYMLSLPKLARACGLSVNTTNRAVLSLASRGLIRYRRGTNQSRPSIYEISTGEGDKLSPEATGIPRIGIPTLNDKYSIKKELYIGDKDDTIGEPVHNQNRESEPDPKERLACRIADSLGDIKNLRLYQSYCRRFPTDLILKAYVRAKEPTPDKIKVSRGALFNFLVQLYAKKRDQKDYSGD